METNATKIDHRTKDEEKPRSKGRIQVIVERVAEVRGVDARALFLMRRESERVAGARSVAMAACCAVGIPICHIARAFGRQWNTVHSAEMQASRRYRNSASFRAEWDKITEGQHEREG